MVLLHTRKQLLLAGDTMASQTLREGRGDLRFFVEF